MAATPASTDDLLRFFFRIDGRISRLEYVLGAGFIYLVNCTLLIYGVVHQYDTANTTAFFLIGFVLSVPLVVGLVVVTAKRCHDLGLPGSYFLLLLVPLVGVVWLFVLALRPGNPGPNAYGPQPAFEPE